MALAAGLLSSFLINSTVAIGLSLIGSWLSPNQSKQAPEDVPNLGAGTPLYSVWGTSWCPTSLLYAVPAAKIGASEETSTFGCLTLANPDNTCSLVAVRANNFIVSSNSPQFNLNAPENVIPKNQTYVNSYGLKTYNNFTYTVQLGSTVPNPDFATLGYGGLTYQGLGWIRADKVKRSTFGGFNSRLSVYLKNRITSNTPATYDVRNNQPVEVQVTLETPGFFTTVWYDNKFSYPSGFHGARVFRNFKDSGYSLIGIGGDGEYVLQANVPGYSNIYFKVLSNINPGGTITPQGQFTQLNGSQVNQGLVNKLVVGKVGQKLSEVTMSGFFQSPFSLNSGNGQVKDASNTVVHTLPLGIDLYGWDGKIFYNPNDNFYPITGGSLISGSPPTSGTYTLAFTNLSTILTDLLVSKGVPTSKIVFTSNFTDVQVRGYTDTTENVKDKIINLCTAYAKVVDDGFDGIYKFSDYPTGITIARNYTLVDLLEEPEMVDTPEIEQPDQVEFTYRNWSTEFSERIVRVGYGTEFVNQKSTRINLVLTETEAKKCAWNMLFLTSHTNKAVRIRVGSISNVEPGKVITLSLPGINLKLLVANIEIGADRTYIINCVNFVPLAELNSNGAGAYVSYMLGTSNTSTSPKAQALATDPYLIAAEPTFPQNNQPYAGTLLYTLSNTLYKSFEDNGNLNPVFTAQPSVSGYEGVVQTVTSSWGDDYLGGRTITLYTNKTTLPPVTANGLIRLGNSWCKYASSVTNGSTTTLNGVETGLYGSNERVYPGDRAVQVPPSNQVLGHTVTVGQFKPAIVDQDGSTFRLYHRPPDTQTPLGVSIGDVTTQYPYGCPAAGLVCAKVMSSYHAGVLKLWLSVPGATHPNGELFDNPVSTNTLIHNNYWLKPLVGAPIFLGNNLSGYQEISVTVPPGQYEIYQKTSGGVNLPTGSYSWIGFAS